jgi:hypothetical protein
VGLFWNTLFPLRVHSDGAGRAKASTIISSSRPEGRVSFERGRCARRKAVGRNRIEQ